MGKSYSRVTYITLIIGLAMVAGAAYWASRTSAFIDRAAVAVGKVIDLERSRSGDSSSYHPVVKFRTAAGQERTFRSSTGTNPPSYRVGEAVEVLYSESEPSDARIRGFFSLWGGPLIVGGMGMLFMLLGGGIVYARRASTQRAIELRRGGRPVQTRFQSVEQNTGTKMNGRSPWRIVTQWKNPSTGEIHVFNSDDIWYDPTPHLQAGHELTVFIDRANPRRYYMDTSFLPKLAE